MSFFNSSSATTFPSNKWISRWACFTNRGSCVTIQMVAPSRCRACSSSITASPLRESRFPVGSSANRIEGFHDPLLAFRRRHILAIRQWQFDIFVNGEIADQIETLKDEADLAVANARTRAEVQVFHRSAIQLILAAGWGIQQPDDRE